MALRLYAYCRLGPTRRGGTNTSFPMPRSGSCAVASASPAQGVPHHFPAPLCFLVILLGRLAELRGNSDAEPVSHAQQHSPLPQAPTLAATEGFPASYQSGARADGRRSIKLDAGTNLFASFPSGKRSDETGELRQLFNLITGEIHVTLKAPPWTRLCRVVFAVTCAVIKKHATLIA